MKIDLQDFLGQKELFRVPELCSLIIAGMQQDGNVHLYTKEGKNGYNNGLFELLDELCKYWKWDKSQITIESVCPYNTHDKYNIIYRNYSDPAVWFNDKAKVLPWNGEKLYGMFIGRANASRIYALQQHNDFEFKDKSISSFNDDLFNFMTKSELVSYFINSNKTYTDVLSMKTPYSEIGPIIKPPIHPGVDTMNWTEIYEQIGIEIVCEVSAEPETPEISEKILKPLYFKRPFLLVGSPNSLKFLRDHYGIKSFNDFFPENYDTAGERNFERVKKVFELLRYIITDITIERLLDQTNDILEYNHRRVIELCQEHRKILKSAPYLNPTSIWGPR